MKRWLSTRWLTTFRASARVTESYGVAAVLSLLLHLLMLALLMITWNNSTTIKRLPPVPISAALVPLPESSSAAVDMQQATPVQKEAQKQEKAQAQEQEEARRAEALAEAKREAEAKKRLEEERQKALARKKEEKKRQQLLRQQEEARRRQKEQERLQEEQENRERLEQQQREQEALAQTTDMEQQEIQDAQQLVSDQLEQAKYATLIRSLTSQYWNRPPSARNNMMAEIRISLSPMGDVLAITMVKSSGNDEFDRSVIQAIRRAAPFSELKNLERRIFDQYFRSITFRFRPEDLVR